VAYAAHFAIADNVITNLATVVAATPDPILVGQYTGFAAVSAVTVYELAIKEVFFDFAQRQNRPGRLGADSQRLARASRRPGPRGGIAAYVSGPIGGTPAPASRPEPKKTALKTEAAKILPLPTSQNAQALPAPAELLKMKGDVMHGEAVFYRQLPGCFACHQVKGKGTQVGPDLSEIGSKLGKDAIIEAILEPNAGISVGYETYSLELKSGDEAYGLLTSDSADEIAIKDLKGIVTRYKKNEIVSRRQLKTSIMPTGLQQSMTVQDFIDLVEFLSSLKKP